MQVERFDCPTKLYMGSDALDALGSFRASRALVVTDPYFSASRWMELLRKAMPDTQVEIFDHVTPDPPAALAAEGTARCSSFAPELLVALGGGSAMDLAKAIRAAWEGEMTFVAIPTTSGSGSEVTSFSILTHGGIKHPLVDAALRPDAAILDDRFLQELPPGLIADGGMDLLSHCVEALGAKNRSCITDALALHGARLALRDLAASYGGDRSRRMALHQAAAMAGLAFDHAGLGVCHALAHALGGALHLSHGRLCAMLLPPVMEVNAAGALEQYALLARSCGLPGQTDRLALRQLLSAIVSLRRRLGMPENLRQAGVEKRQWLAVRPEVLAAALADPCGRTNPVPVDAALLEEILKRVEA